MSVVAPALPVSGRRVTLAYLAFGAFFAAALVVSLTLGADKKAPPRVEGEYTTHGFATACLGRNVVIHQSGQFLSLSGANGSGGTLRLKDGRITGTLDCSRGEPRHVVLRGRGNILVAGTTVIASFLRALPEPGVASIRAPKKRSSEDTFGHLMLAMAVVVLAARLVGLAIGRFGQPPVMGEVLAGILLGPTLLGAIAPASEHYLFPPDIVPLLAAAADIGLAFYMFLVGLELDPRLLRGRVTQTAFISNASVLFPLSLGLLAAVPLYGLLGDSRTRYFAFALFMGVSMSITAFPVLARILVERRMLKHPLGTLALSAAAIDDVTAWGLLALASAVALSGSGLHAVWVVLLAIAFCSGMALLGRPLLRRVSVAYDEAGHVPREWVVGIFVSVLVSAFVAESIGIAAIFGAFVMGLIMPRRADLSHDITRRVEDFVSTLLLPLFFVVTGLKTRVGLLDRPILWVLTLVLILIAIVGKGVGAALASRLTNLPGRESSVVGILMNTRGLTELIVLNIGLDLHVISPALFTMLVIMALVTTFMTGPLLKLVDPRGSFTDPAEEELRRARSQPLPTEEPTPDRAILVAPLDERNLEALLDLAEPLARTQPPRELIVARLLQPAPIPTGLAVEDREVTRTMSALDLQRQALVSRRIAARTVAFVSADRGSDLVRLASEHEIDLLLLEGRRPLLGEAVPRGEVGAVLADAPCDVAVLVEREGLVELDSEHPVVVPFGGVEHDWAALELGAWLANAAEAPLRLIGAGGNHGGGGDAKRLIESASIVVTQLVGVAAEPILAEGGSAGVLAAAEGAGLLVIGLSLRWRDEGLGSVRSTIARQSTAPTLFVRRGSRPGALAPREDLTRFTWSRAG
jgi:Kef-type K+ transport system membrane component KefB/nucleotide-binding universal stress UspA family protein